MPDAKPREFYALWTCCGPYGPQDVHYHPSWNDRDRTNVLVGPGRECDGKPETHHEARLPLKRMNVEVPAHQSTAEQVEALGAAVDGYGGSMAFAHLARRYSRDPRVVIALLEARDA